MMMRANEFLTEAFSQAAADRNKLKYQKQGRIGHGVGWKPMSDSPHEIVDNIVHQFDNISRIVAYDRSSDRVKHSMVERFMKKYGYPLELFPDVIASIDQQIADSYALARKNIAEDWNKVNHKDKTDGLSQKAVNAYRRENPGSKLKTAVTTKPSKLKAGSKDAKRRKSFCARMSGNKGPMKKPNGKPTPKALALRRWNCESVEEMVDMIIENMDHAKDNQAVPELKAALLAKKSALQQASEDQVYDIIDKMMTRIAKSHGMSGQKLHDMWVKEYDQIPDTWIMK
jgi:hypothetical protein